jgi:hypothetical protein
MKEKPKNPSLEKEKSTTAGKAGTEVELRENSGDDNADTMSDQEMAAFQKIMDEIEDQEEDKLNGPARKDDEMKPLPKRHKISRRNPRPRMILPPNWKRWPAPRTRRKTIPQPIMTTMRI